MNVYQCLWVLFVSVAVLGLAGFIPSNDGKIWSWTGVQILLVAVVIVIGAGALISSAYWTLKFVVDVFVALG